MKCSSNIKSIGLPKCNNEWYNPVKSFKVPVISNASITYVYDRSINYSLINKDNTLREDFINKTLGV